MIAVAECKEFEPTWKYSIFQDLSRRLIETGFSFIKFIKFGHSSKKIDLRIYSTGEKEIYCLNSTLYLIEKRQYLTNWWSDKGLEGTVWTCYSIKKGNLKFRL